MIDAFSDPTRHADPKESLKQLRRRLDTQQDEEEKAAAKQADNNEEDLAGNQEKKPNENTMARSVRGSLFKTKSKGKHGKKDNTETSVQNATVNASDLDEGSESGQQTQNQKTAFELAMEGKTQFKKPKARSLRRQDSGFSTPSDMDSSQDDEQPEQPGGNSTSLLGAAEPAQHRGHAGHEYGRKTPHKAAEAPKIDWSHGRDAEEALRREGEAVDSLGELSDAELAEEIRRRRSPHHAADPS